VAYFLDLFSPETYEQISRSEVTMTGFRKRQVHAAERVHPGDRLLCYQTKTSRWIGVLEVLSDSYIDDTPRYYEENDPFVVRFNVRPVVWLPVNRAIPIREDFVWKTLSFTKNHPKHSSFWTGKFRSSLSPIDEADGQFLEKILMDNPRMARNTRSITPNTGNISSRRSAAQEVKYPCPSRKTRT
jgi:predicted RNA-binding protein